MNLLHSAVTFPLASGQHRCLDDVRHSRLHWGAENKRGHLIGDQESVVPMSNQSPNRETNREGVGRIKRPVYIRNPASSGDHSPRGSKPLFSDLKLETHVASAGAVATADLSFPATSITSCTVKFPYSCIVHSSIMAGSASQN